MIALAHASVVLLIEWDGKLPTLPTLAPEAHRADACVAEIL